VTDERYARGIRVLRELLGDAFVDASIANRTECNGPFFDYVTGAVWSDVWARDGLDRVPLARGAVFVAEKTLKRFATEVGE
jgi:hypothetical protein